MAALVGLVMRLHADSCQTLSAKGQVLRPALWFGVGKRLSIGNNGCLRTHRMSSPVYPLPPHPQQLATSGTSLDTAQSDAALGAQTLNPRTEQARRVSALAFEAVSQGVIVTDAARRIVLVNPAFEAITGFRQVEVEGRTCALLQGPLTDAGTVQEIGRALRAHQAFAGEILNYCKDGSIYWNDLSISPVRDERGELTHFIGITRDITERKRAQAALEEGEARYRDAAEAAGGYIWDLDLNFRYTFVSRAAEDLLGYSAQEMLGRTPAEFMPAGEIARVNKWLDKHLEPDGSMRGLEHRYLTKSGGIFWAQVSRVVMRDALGAVVGYRGTAFDITARKSAEVAHTALEAQLRESQKMEAIGTLAGGIAHDFNNIIAAILGNVALARQDVGATSLAQESLREIHKAATRARDLVRQILSFSRRQQTHYEPTDLAPLIDDTARLLRATLPARVSVDVHCEPGTPSVLADASQIQQIVINLATNATQALGGRPGRIGLRLDSAVLDSATLQRHPTLRPLNHRGVRAPVRITVTDDGPGMDEATRARIFEPFFTTKPVGEGTGLGLAVVHGIVQGHNGVTVVESQPGAGAQFAIYLPACEVGAGAALSDDNPTTPVPQSGALGTTATHAVVAPAAATATEAGPHILFLDDDEALLFLVKRLLERRGYRVSAHHAQQDALDALAADPAGFDLVLTDYNMPGQSGLDIAHRVRDIRPDLPVAIASGFVDETLNAGAAAAGVKGLIFKAMSVEDFCGAIEALVSVPK